jgi:Glycosyltransferases involved in cell wall biogenesis
MTTKKISILIPACNEAAVIDIPIKRCLEAFKAYGYSGEVVIMDSSTDDTPHIAEKLGARVISTPKQGIGKAYIEGLKHVKGDYIIMGDADGTYDFMEMKGFVDRLDAGDDFVMGSRLRGNVHKGAMPWSHRYVGTPLLNWFINVFYKKSISGL